MSIEIRPFSAEWRAAVQEFNGRLARVRMQLPEDPDTEMMPGSRMYVAVENGEVRGGYILRAQDFCFRGEPRRVAHYRLPISEGVINRSYARVGPLLLRSALRQEPLLYALGMGGYHHPLPRMLQAMGWTLSPVPFFFRIVRPARFLRKTQALRRSWLRAALMDIAAFTGAGWLGIRLLQWSLTQRSAAFAVCKETGDFGGWADEIWDEARGEYGMAAARDTQTLRSIYPASSTRFLRMRVNRAGWAVLIDTPMQNDQYFGDLHVGTIVDCMAKPDDAAAVIRAARAALEQRGVDLIISNQSHASWAAALRADGFLPGPSNFLFAASRQLAALASPISELHLNRGDGDGPVHL